MVRSLRARAFSLTWLSYASYYLTRKNFGVVKLRMERELGVSMDMLGIIDTVYLAAYALGQFVTGALGDRLGARRMIGWGMLLSAGLSFAFGASSVAALFLLAFGLNGLVQATGWPNNVKAMAWWFGRGSRGWVMGVWCTCYQVGGLVATALATWLLIHHGWRAAFFVPGMWVALVGAVVLVFLVERPQDRGLPAVDEPPKGAAPVERVGFRAIVRMPAVWLLGGSYFGLKLIRYSLLFWLPYYLSQALHYDEGTAGYLSTSFEVGGILGAVVTGWVSDRWFPARRARLAAPMVLALAGALLLYRGVGDAGLVANALSMALVGFLLFGPDALISGAAAQDLGGGASAASAAGIINGIGSVGAILQGVVTTRVSSIWGWDVLFLVFVGLAVISALLLVPLARQR
ncbi:MAG: hypothetical protein AMXMBFR64_56570 [Myxococcales bacterium]